MDQVYLLARLLIGNGEEMCLLLEHHDANHALRSLELGQMPLKSVLLALLLPEMDDRNFTPHHSPSDEYLARREAGSSNDIAKSFFRENGYAHHDNAKRPQDPETLEALG